MRCRGGYDLFWKEWRTRGWLLLLLAIVIFFSPWIGLLGETMLILEYSGESRLLEDLLSLGTAYLLSALFLGLVLFSREETDPARGFLYTLPLSRRRILQEKLASFGTGLLILAAVFMIRFLPLSSEALLESGTNGILSAIVPFLVAAVPVVLFAGILSLHIRSVIVALLISVVFIIPLLVILAVGNLPLDDDLFLNVPLVNHFWLFVDGLLLSLGLGLWLFYLYCRTPIFEMSSLKRVLFGILFGAVTIEVAATVFLCDFRDLVYILLGV